MRSPARWGGLAGSRPPLEGGRALSALLGLIGCAGYIQMINAGAAPFYAAEFQLNEGELARMFAWMSLGSLGTSVLARWMDRVGRRRALLVSVGGLGLGAVATALAPTLTWLIAAQIWAWSFGRTLQNAGTVIVSEELPSETRARGQSRNGIAVHLGSGAGLIGIACVADLPGSWRWAWIVPALPVLALPLLVRLLRETQPFEAARLRGETEQARIGELFRGAYARRTAAVLAAYSGLHLTSYGTMTWLLYHAQATHGLSPLVATAIVISGGALGLVGFPLGASMSDRIGRRATALVFGVCFAVCNVGYYWVPGDLWLSPVLGLAGMFTLASVGWAGVTVSMRTATTELFPTRLRGTLQGLVSITSTFGAITAMVTIAVLTELLGSLALGVSVVGVACIPGVIVFFAALPETAGTELDAAE